MATPASPSRAPDWEAFYRDYRKPGYVPGFEITSKLGGGMFGLVFRARKQSIGKDYAIKFLQVDDTEVRRAVLAELEQVKWFAQIDHPNLVSIEDRGEVDGIPYLVMSFAGTETLRDRMPSADGRTGGAPPSPEQRDELVRYFLQCCRGLSALHERSLVHFDIKPANVFLKGSVARLGDYGLSKLVTHSRGSLSMGRGTPYYMAPEMLQRRGDLRSDIYSLGVMLYEILCGRVPFTGDSEWEVLRQHETKTPDLPPHLTAIERAVLQRCLQKDPAARFQSVHDLIAAFESPSAAQLAPAPDLDRQAPTCVVPGPASARRRGGTGLLAFVAVAAVFVWLAAVAGRVHTGGSIAPVALAPQWRPAPTSLASQIERAKADVQSAVRAAVQRRVATDLTPLDADRLNEPRGFDECRDRVEALAGMAFSPAHVRRLEQWGRAAFLAAVSLLQEFDYECATDCRRAANLHRMLDGLTGIGALVVQPIAAEPTPVDTCRFAAVAAGWRRFAEQFANDDTRFEQMLAVCGRRTVAGVTR